jgi:hypothetical protein
MIGGKEGRGFNFLLEVQARWQLLQELFVG